MTVTDPGFAHMTSYRQDSFFRKGLIIYQTGLDP